MNFNQMGPIYRIWLHSFEIFVCVSFLSVNVNGSANTLHHGKCFSGQQFMVLSSTFDGCIDACIVASHCEALVYDRRASLCKIYDLIGTITICPGNIIVMKDDISKNEMDVCGINGCPITDCGPIPSVPGEAVVHGNQVSLNSVVKYTCTHNGEVTYVKCQSDGQWSTLPNCTNPDCGEPTYYLANGEWTLDGGTTLIGDTATYTCIAAHRLEPPSVGIQVACSGSTQWETPNATCVAAKNGKSCTQDVHCVDENAICIRQQADHSLGKCFCKPGIAYDNAVQACTEACVLSDNFDDSIITPNYYISGYTVGSVHNNVLSDVDCFNLCVQNGAVSADYNDGDQCACNAVTFQQIIDSNTYQKMYQASVRNISKGCMP